MVLQKTKKVMQMKIPKNCNTLFFFYYNAKKKQRKQDNNIRKKKEKI